MLRCLGRSGVFGPYDAHMPADRRLSREQRRSDAHPARRDRETLAHYNAVTAQYAFARRHWRTLALALSGSMVVTPLALLVEGESRGAFLGFYVAVVGGMLVNWVVIASGSATLLMGDQGEQWTRESVAPLRKKGGWRVIHNAMLKKRDIDTVVIGPTGVAVIETKWSGGDWSSRHGRSVIRDAALDISDSARDIRLLLQTRAHAASQNVRAAVVLWGPSQLAEPMKIEGVDVLNGEELVGWIASVNSDGVPQEEIDTAATLIGNQTLSREDYESARRKPRPRAPGELLFDLLRYFAGGVAGLLATLFASQLLPFPLALMPMAAVTAFAYAAHRLSDVRQPARAAFVVSFALVLGFSTLYIGYVAWALISDWRLW